MKHLVRMGVFAAIVLGGKFLEDLTADYPPSATRRYIETAVATVLFGVIMAVADRFLERRA